MASQRLNPVAWTEGMFLRPQHFQHGDLYSDLRLQHHLSVVDPFHWGVRELVVDEEALSDHQLVVLRLDAVLPGGTILRYPGNALVESREFDPSLERIDVHIGLRRLSETSPNTAPAANDARDARYVLETHEIPDLNRSGQECPLELAHPNARVFLTGEEHALELYESFKLAEIVATGELARPFRLSPTYAPPLITMSAFAPLYDDLAGILSQMAAKVRVVAGRTTTVALGSIDKMWIRYTLSRMTPVLRHVLSTGNARPFEVYGALVETAGSLAAFNVAEQVELPPYDHEDLYGCFQALIRFIDTQLNEVVPHRFTELKLPFDAREKIYATSELNTDRVSPRNMYYLAVKAHMPSAELNEWVEKYGKAGSLKGAKMLVRLNLPGLRLEHLPGAPTEIAGAAGFEYYKVEPHGPQWAKVREEFSFAVSLGKLENADARLFIVSGEN